jgi:hypothetical protein
MPTAPALPFALARGAKNLRKNSRKSVNTVLTFYKKVV